MKKLIAGSMLLSLSGASIATATPTLYPSEFNVLSSIKNPTTSNLIGDDADSNTVYVMPPNEGYANARGIHTTTANLLFCSNLKQLATQSERLEGKIGELRLRQAEQVSKLEEFDRQIATAATEAGRYATANHLSELAQIDSRILQVNGELAARYAELEKCNSTCEQLAKDTSHLQLQVAELSRARTEFYVKNLSAVRIYDQKKAVVDALTLQKEELFRNYDKLQDTLLKASTQLVQLFSTYGAMEGGRAAFSFRSSWNDNIETLRKLNPGINFAVLNTQNTKIYPGVLGVTGLPATGAVLGFEAPGVATAKNGEIAMSSYPASLDGNVILSLAGACPMVHPEMFKFNQNSTPQNMKFGMLVSYEFPTAMKLSLKVTYNMAKMHTLLRASGSHGGFFSRRQWTNSEERLYFKDAFKVDWTSQDPENTLSDDQRMAMERDARAQIASRLLAIALPNAADKNALSLASHAQPAGAVLLADSLMSSCPGNIYCLAGSSILKGLSGILGSDSNSNSLTQIQDVDQTEEWTQSKVVLKPWITNYRTTSN